MYQIGQKVKYTTSRIKAQSVEISPQTKVGVIEDSFLTLDKIPCYWIKEEPELILHRQIIETVKGS